MQEIPRAVLERLQPVFDELDEFDTRALGGDRLSYISVRQIADVRLSPQVTFRYGRLCLK